MPTYIVYYELTYAIDAPNEDEAYIKADELLEKDIKEKGVNQNWMTDIQEE